MYESVAKSGPFTTRALVCSIVFHVGLLGFFWIMGMIVTRKPDVIIPIDMTVVPPWAEQTDDPNPDPNPPPPKQEELPKPTPPPPEVKPPDPKVEEAVEKIVEKPKPPKPPEKPKEKRDLRKGAKLIKTPIPAPQPVNLRDKATKIEPPPNIRKFGSATAKSKPLSEEEIKRLLNMGANYGSDNQIPKDEIQRCLGVIKRRIQEQCDRESVNWQSAKNPPVLNLWFGPGGRLTKYSIATSSGDGNVDLVIMNALGRIGSIPGLSRTFLESDIVKNGILLEVKAQ